jgi:TPR repeat protein
MIIFPDFTEDEMDLQAGADAYQNGDYEKAVAFYTKSAAAGNVTALSNLGYCHYYGRGVPTDKNAAKNCWERAGILGDIAAVYKLGDMYRNGDLKEDLDYSHALYRRAFQMALDSDDIYVYPDAFLRMLKYYPDEACTEDRDALDIGRDCVDGIEQRIAEGDHYSERVLREAKRILSELERKESE